MKMMKFVLAFLIFFFADAWGQGSTDLGEKRNRLLTCYYGSWARYRPGNGNFNVANVKPELCDYFIYSFVGLKTDLDINLMDLEGDLTHLKDLRRRSQSSMKLLLAIGGWNEGSGRFSQMAATAESRQLFVRRITAVIQKYDFDGLDLDWEYPAQRDGAPSDKANFALLLRVLREEFNKHGFKLTAAVGAPQSFIESSYDVPALDKYLDFIHLMTYDFHGSWDRVTGQNSPLYPPANKPEDFSVSGAVQKWIRAGARPSKLIVGIALYGRTFTLSDAKKNGIGAEVVGAGVAGEYSREAGYMSFLEICEALRAGGWTITYDNVQKNPYASKGKQWVGYDDVRSVTEKAQYIDVSNLGGAMVWSIDNDDANNNCGLNAFPLLRAIHKVLVNAKPLTIIQDESGSTPIRTTTTSITTTTVRSTSPSTTTKTTTTLSTPVSSPITTKSTTTTSSTQTTRTTTKPTSASTAATPQKPTAPSSTSTSTSTIITKPTTTSATTLPTPSTPPLSDWPWNQLEANQKCNELAIRRAGQPPQAPEPFANRIGQCTKHFVQCVLNNDDTFIAYLMDCPGDLRFHQYYGLCDYADSIEDCKK